MNELPHTRQHSTETTSRRGSATVGGLVVSVAMLAGFLSFLVAPLVVMGAFVGAVSLRTVQTVTATQTRTPPPDERDAPV